MWIMWEAVSLPDKELNYNVCFACLQYDITMDLSNATSISGCGFWSGVPHKFYAFTKWLMGGAPRTYAFIQISEMEIPFTTIVENW